MVAISVYCRIPSSFLLLATLSLVHHDRMLPTFITFNFHRVPQSLDPQEGGMWRGWRRGGQLDNDDLSLHGIHLGISLSLQFANIHL